MHSGTPDLATIAGWIRSARRVTVLTGAGISTESGIPDFRGPQGVWTKDPQAEKMAHISFYMTDPEVRMKSWQARLTSPIWKAQPSRGHLALAELERKDKLHTLVTQNVDGLHLQAGTSASLLIEIHGTAHEVMCMDCGERAPMERALARVRAGEQDPPCRTCGGILKSATISFGQGLIPEDLERAERAALACDLFMSVGSSLGVYPVAELPAVALRAGARLIIVNDDATPYDSYAGAVVQGKIGELLPALVDLV